MPRPGRRPRRCCRSGPGSSGCSAHREAARERRAAAGSAPSCDRRGWARRSEHPPIPGRRLPRGLPAGRLGLDVAVQGLIDAARLLQLLPSLLAALRRVASGQAGPPVDIVGHDRRDRLVGVPVGRIVALVGDTRRLAPQTVTKVPADQPRPGSVPLSSLVPRGQSKRGIAHDRVFRREAQGDLRVIMKT